MTIRLFLISPRYRDPIDFTDSGLRQAEAQRGRLSELVDRLRGVSAPGGVDPSLAKGLLDGFEDSMDDDLNTPRALSVLFTFAKKVNTLIDSGSLGKGGADSVLGALRRVDSVLGVLDFGRGELEPRLAELLARREAARGRKDYAESDRIRDVLLAEGIVVEDTPGGTRWKRSPRG